MDFVSSSYPAVKAVKQPLLQFALGPSDFSVGDVEGDELPAGASRGAKVLYQFPWGTETLETLWMVGNGELLRSHAGGQAKLQVLTV